MDVVDHPDQAGWDVTDLLATLEATQRSKAFLETVLTVSPDYVFVLDVATGAVVYSTPGKTVLGLTTEQIEALGAAAIELIHPDDRAKPQAANAAAVGLRTGEVVETMYRGRHADGSWHWLNRRATPFRRDESGRVTEILGTLHDVTEVVHQQEQLTHAALHDSLTGLPNRTLFVDRLEAALRRASHENRVVSVLYCDLDNFKHINDTAGHAAGDTALVQTARRLQSALRPGDTVARLGGDEFVVLLEPWNRLPSPQDRRAPAEPDSPAHDLELAGRLAERLAEAVSQPIEMDDAELVVTASIGIAHGPTKWAGDDIPVTAEEVMGNADTAMYLAKKRGKNDYEVFDKTLRAGLAEHARIQQVLQQTLSPRTLWPRDLSSSRARARRRFPVLAAAYQPVFSSGTGALVSFEALARLRDRDDVIINPEDFIRVAEDSGQISSLGVRMLDLACGQLAAWRREPPALHGVTMAVNVSAVQLQRGDFEAVVRGALRNHRLAPVDLILELTETSLYRADDATIGRLRSLQEDGTGIVIDDFGVGYASLRYLATLPVTGVKIDRSFTCGLPFDRTSTKIVRAVTELASGLGVSCVVEGVETPEQRAALPDGVLVQGYLLGRPEQPGDIDLRRFSTAPVT